MAFSQFNQIFVGFIPGTETNQFGLVVRGPNTPIEISGSLQPAAGSDLEILPEGKRLDSTYIVFSKQEIKENWRLTLNGLEHTCVKVETWKNNVISHYKAFFQKTEIV